MPDKKPLSEEERAELVAYLDGEASPAAARDMEARLNRDPRLRAEAESLRRAWQLLDFLPKPEPSEQFAHRTMTAASVVCPSPRLFGRRWMIGLGWTAALIALAVVGYAAAPLLSLAAPSPHLEQPLPRDLRVIENLRLYEAGQDLPFLNELDRPELFGDEHAGF